ncbi:MAG: HNH endonuclease [Pseudomonadota bacterium]
MRIKIVFWSDIDTLKNKITKIIKSIAEIIDRHDIPKRLTIDKISIYAKEPQFPTLFIFHTESKFISPFGEEFFAVNNEISISLDNLRKIESGFNGELLHQVARIEVSEIPIDSSHLSFEELIKPGLYKGTSKIQDRMDRYIPSSVRREVWRRDQGMCVNCGNRKNLEYDHIIPVSEGGSNTARNIELLCEECNRKKSNKIE